MGKFEQLSPPQQKAILLLTNQMIEDGEKLTYAQIADRCSVDLKTLWRWRTQDSDFIEARAELTRSYSNELVGEAFAALRYQLIKNHSVKAAEVSLRANGMLIDRKEVRADVKAEVTNVSDKSLDDLRAELESLRVKVEVDIREGPIA